MSESFDRCCVSVVSDLSNICCCNCLTVSICKSCDRVNDLTLFCTCYLLVNLLAYCYSCCRYCICMLIKCCVTYCTGLYDLRSVGIICLLLPGDYCVVIMSERCSLICGPCACVSVCSIDSCSYELSALTL